jgi:hypothetical protein
VEASHASLAGPGCEGREALGFEFVCGPGIFLRRRRPGIVVSLPALASSDDDLTGGGTMRRGERARLTVGLALGIREADFIVDSGIGHYFGTPEVGINVTVTTQFDPAASVPMHVLEVMAKSLTAQPYLPYSGGG